MDPSKLMDDYLAGPALLRQAVAGMTDAQLDAAPVPGKWSTRQVVCHIADFEPVYADRIKRVIAEDQPTFFGGNPDRFAARLAYAHRDIQEELALVEAVRRHVGRILRALPEDVFQRMGNHSEDGLLSLTTLLQRVTDHLPHHVKFIAEKRKSLGS